MADDRQMDGGLSPPHLALPATESPAGLLPGEHWAEVTDSLSCDNEAALGDDDVTSTASITSSILEYRTVLGRTYHSKRGNTLYLLYRNRLAFEMTLTLIRGANDEKQQEMLDLAHHFLTLCLGGKLHLAPIGEKMKKALDIGTGTGIWAIDFADQYPNCEVIGTDISPIQPIWLPSNLNVEIDDFTQPWTFDSDSLNFVHGRYLLGSIGDWVALAKEAYKCLAPGGYFESYEASPFIVSADGTVPETSAMGQWGKIYEDGGKKLGQSFTIVPDGVQKTAMEQAGFVDIEEWVFNAPLGQWPEDPKLKEIGMYGQLALEHDITGFLTFVANLQGWSKVEIEAYAARFRRDLRNNEIHGTMMIRVIWGQKTE